MMKDHQESWKKHECTVRSDRWRDRAIRDFINSLVNCPKGSMFIEALDASLVFKTREMQVQFLDKDVETVVR